MPKTIAIDGRRVRDFGVGGYVRNLVESLAKIESDHEFVVLVGSEEEILRDLPDRFHFAVDRCPSYSLRELASLSWQVRRRSIDLFHSTHYVLPAFMPARTVVTVHDIVHLLYPSFLPNRLALAYAQRMIRRSLTRGEQIIAVSQNTKSDLMEYFDVDPRKIDVVYNGVAQRFCEQLSEDELSRKLKTLEVERPYILFVGDAEKSHKNLDGVVQAYARARGIADIEAPLICVGAREGSDFKILQRARQLGVGDEVRLLGNVASEALPALYQGATLFLYPTLYEGSGLPIVEAMCSGVPVVTSNTATLREVGEGYAHMISPLGIDEIAHAIAHCMTDSDHRSALAKLGKRRAQDFSWERTAQRTLDIYEAVLRQRGTPPLEVAS